jgi:hypothetical protein
LADHLDLRGFCERRLDPVADERGVERQAVERDHERPLASVFGESLDQPRRTALRRVDRRQAATQRTPFREGAQR